MPSEPVHIPAPLYGRVPAGLVHALMPAVRQVPVATVAALVGAHAQPGGKHAGALAAQHHLVLVAAVATVVLGAHGAQCSAGMPQGSWDSQVMVRV